MRRWDREARCASPEKGDSLSDPFWWLTKDGDKACLALYEKHYSAHRYQDGRRRVLFCGPGVKLVLRAYDGSAFFVWREFKDDCIDMRTGLRQEGINCAAFRNESGAPRQSGDDGA